MARPYGSAFPQSRNESGSDSPDTLCLPPFPSTNQDGKTLTTFLSLLLSLVSYYTLLSTRASPPFRGRSHTLFDMPLCVYTSSKRISPNPAYKPSSILPSLLSMLVTFSACSFVVFFFFLSFGLEGDGYTKFVPGSFIRQTVVWTRFIYIGVENLNLAPLSPQRVFLLLFFFVVLSDPLGEGEVDGWWM